MTNPKNNPNNVISNLSNSNGVAIKTRKFVPRTPEIMKIPEKAPAPFAKTFEFILIISLSKLFHR